MVLLLSLCSRYLQVGAHIHTVTKEEYTQTGSEALLQQLSGQLRSQGKKPYSIPVGGSNPLGSWGYLEAVRELEGQVANVGITDIVLVSLCTTTCASAQREGHSSGPCQKQWWFLSGCLLEAA